MSMYVEEGTMARYIKKSGLSIRQAAGQFFIIDTAQGKIHHLNETARLVWDWLDSMTPGEMARKMSSLYDVDSERALKDITAVIELLKKEGLIHDA